MKRRLLLSLFLLGSACQREAPREPVVRFETRQLGIPWDEMPTTIEERRALAAAELKKGQALMAAGEEVEGVAHLRRAVDLHPGSPELRWRLALGFERLHDPDAALRVLRESLRIAPNDPQTLYHLGRLLFLVVRTEDAAELGEAQRAWQTLTRVAPKSKLAEKVQRHFPELSRAAGLAKESPQLAAKQLAGASAKEAATAASPGGLPTEKIPTDDLFIGNELMERARYADAARAYAKLVARNPDDGDARRLLGLAHFRAGDFRAAVKAWEPLSRAGGLSADTARMLEEARRKSPQK
jgi:tetratricopeptide (TPR) repeat protein